MDTQTLSKKEVIESLNFAVKNDKNLDLVGYELTSSSNHFYRLSNKDGLTFWWFLEGSREITLVCDIDTTISDYSPEGVEYEVSSIKVKEVVVVCTNTSEVQNLAIEKIEGSELLIPLTVLFKREKLRVKDFYENLVFKLD